ERALELRGRELLQLRVDRARRAERPGERGREQTLAPIEASRGGVLAAGGGADVAGAGVAVIAVCIRLAAGRQGAGGRGRQRRRRRAARGRGVRWVRGAGRRRRNGRRGRRRCTARADVIRHQRVDRDQSAVETVEGDDERVVRRLVQDDTAARALRS